MEKILWYADSICRTGCTTEEFNSFPIGTFRADIVDWFYKTFEVDIDALKEMTGRYDNINSEDIPEYIKETAISLLKVYS